MAVTLKFVSPKHSSFGVVNDLHQTAHEDCTYDKLASPPCREPPLYDNKGNGENKKVSDKIGTSHPDEHFPHCIAAHAV